VKLPKGVAVAEEEIVVVGKSERLAVELGVVLRVKKTEKLEEGLELGESETETVELRVLATGESVGEAVLEGERVEEGLLAEVFSNEGIGTLIHANEYQAIRRARKKDAPAIHRLIAKSVANDELLKRTRTEIERQAEDFFVFEVDREPVGCVAVHPFPEKSMVELACLCVDPRYENQGIGKRLMQFAENQARSTGFARIFCLSTQTFNFFQQKGGFSPGSPEDLPPARREKYEKSGRKSLVLFKSAK
jgi:amino-acid N-acetyltransferase